jgi:hypothetical protein
MALKNFAQISEKSKLILFFVFTLSWTWTFWMLRILISNNTIDFPISEEECKYYGGIGPILVALILTFLGEGKSGIKSLLKRGLDYKFKKKMWIPLLFLTTVTSFLAYQMINLFTPVPNIVVEIEIGEFVGGLIILLIISISEEFGWRGYALDRLQDEFKSSKYTALISSLILGSVWGIWHLPLFFTKNEGKSHEIQYFPYFLLMAILLAILFTWFYNNSNRSILTAIIFHTSINFSGLIVPVTNSYAIPYEQGYLALNSLIFIFIILLVIYYGTKSLKLEHSNKMNNLELKTLN